MEKIASSEMDLKLLRPIEDYAAFLEGLGPRSVSLIDNLVVPGVAFSDPHFEVRGAEAYKDLLHWRLSVGGDCFMRTEDVGWCRRGASGLVFWRMCFEARRRPLFASAWGSQGDRGAGVRELSGVTQIDLSPDGRIVGLREFWDRLLPFASRYARWPGGKARFLS